MLPILFSGPLVRAIREGRKTQTRRVIRNRAWAASGWATDDDNWPVIQPEHVQGKWERLRCPYGQPGDRLWVKEAIRFERAWQDGYETSVFVADGTRTKADAWPWKLKTLPGMFMPRGLSRITLEVVSVRVERLQDITPEDAVAEGISFPRCSCEVCSRSIGMCPADQSQATMLFMELWESINAEKHPWESNPLLWVIDFKQVTP